MRLLLTSVFCIFLSYCANSQSGFLGALNSVSIETTFGPSYRHTNVIKNDVAIKRLRLFYNKINVNYSRVVSKNIELSIGFEYNKGTAFTVGSYFIKEDTVYVGTQNMNIQSTTYRFLQDPHFTNHSVEFSFKYYRLGSLAPIGKYIGFSFKTGIANLSIEEPILIGKKDTAFAHNFYRSKSNIGVIDTFNLNEDVNIGSTFLFANIGRNYPITDNLVLGVGFTIPIFSLFINKSTGLYHLGRTIDSSIDEDKDSSWSEFTMNSIKKYNRISFNFSLRFHF